MRSQVDEDFLLSVEARMEKTAVQIKHIAPLSVAKVFGLVYAFLGLIIGAIFSCISVIGSAAAAELAGDALFGLLFGIGAIIAMPIFYGILGFIAGLVVSAIYNVVAGRIGGIELVLE
jgi:hypothetical protein